MQSNLKIAVALLSLACFVLPCRADDVADKGREVFKKYQQAVVTVQVVQKTSYSSQGRSGTPSESRQDITGTVVDPSGLTVLALSACDPSEMYQRMMSDRYPDYKVETEISDIKILLEDGTELPCQIVLRDKDLDLAFIRPKTKLASPLSAADLSKAGQAQILDQVITLNRLSKATGRAYSASIERITGVVQKPRTFYIPDSTMTSTSLGSPAFTLDGAFLGLNVLRMVGSPDGGGYNYRADNVTGIILPASDIAKAAKQAPEVKADEEKPEGKEKSADAKPEGAKESAPAAPKKLTVEP